MILFTLGRLIVGLTASILTMGLYDKTIAWLNRKKI